MIFVALIGPTAVGKTELSLELAGRLGAEIVSADSRQVYRYLDIGTDKVSPEVRRQVLHHCIDLCDPDKVFSAADFVGHALDAARRIGARGRVPMLVGGTPLYYRALEGRMITEDLPSDEAVRAALTEEMSVLGRETMHAELCSVDPELGKRIHPNDGHRIARGLEIYRVSGHAPSWWFARQGKMGGVHIVYAGLIRERAHIVRRIDERVHSQFRCGYPEEVRWLLDNGYSPTLPAMQGFGYRELVMYHRGELTLEEAILGDIRATKAFSRRQMTWFRRFEPCVWYDIDVQGRGICDEIYGQFSRAMKEGTP